MNARNAIVFAAALAVVACIACAFALQDGGGHSNDGDRDAEHMVDAAGRSVPIPESIDSIATVGKCGPARFLSVFDRDGFHPMDMVVECDERDRSENKGGRGFLYAFDLTDVPHAHPDFQLDSETTERIAGLDPSLVIMNKDVYLQNRSNADVLAKRCPVLVIPDQDMESFFHFDETGRTLKLDGWYVETIAMLGRALGQEDRAAEHISDVEGLLNDVRKYVGATEETSYVVGVAYSGSHAWNTTFPTYIPLELAGGRNAYEKRPGDKTNVELPAEQAMEVIADAGFLLVDPTSSDKMGATPEDNSQMIMRGIHEINTDSDPGNDIRIYSVVSIVWCSMNYDSAIACAYQLCHILYGTLSEEEMQEKIDHVFETFYGEAGKDVREDMTAFFEQKAAKSGVTQPMLSELRIVEKGGIYTTEPIAPAA